MNNNQNTNNNKNNGGTEKGGAIFGIILGFFLLGGAWFSSPYESNALQFLFVIVGVLRLVFAIAIVSDKDF